MSGLSSIIRLVELGGNRLTEICPGCPPGPLSPVESELRVWRVGLCPSGGVPFVTQVLPRIWSAQAAPWSVSDGLFDDSDRPCHSVVEQAVIREGTGPTGCHLDRFAASNRPGIEDTRGCGMRGTILVGETDPLAK